MINILLLVSVVLGVYFQNIFNKAYLKKNEKSSNESYFNFVMALSAFLIFAVLFLTSDNTFHLKTFIYSQIFSVFFSLAIIFLILAIKAGSLTLTALILSYSQFIPAILGVAFLGENLKIYGIVGLLLLVLSIYFISKKSSSITISFKWVIYALLMALGNGLCAFTQKLHQFNMPGQHLTQFMFWSMLTVTIICGIFYFLKRSKNQPQKFISKNAIYPFLSGVSNAGVNILMLTLASLMPASILYPTVSAGGIVLTFFTAVLFFKEKLSKKQTAGLILGVISIVLLSI